MGAKTEGAEIRANGPHSFCRFLVRYAEHGLAPGPEPRHLFGHKVKPISRMGRWSRPKGLALSYPFTCEKRRFVRGGKCINATDKMADHLIQDVLCAVGGMGTFS